MITTHDYRFYTDWIEHFLSVLYSNQIPFWGSSSAVCSYYKGTDQLIRYLLHPYGEESKALIYNRETFLEKYASLDDCDNYTFKGLWRLRDE